MKHFLSIFFIMLLITLTSCSAPSQPKSESSALEQQQTESSSGSSESVPADSTSSDGEQGEKVKENVAKTVSDYLELNADTEYIRRDNYSIYAYEELPKYDMEKIKDVLWRSDTVENEDHRDDYDLWSNGGNEMLVREKATIHYSTSRWELVQSVFRQNDYDPNQNIAAYSSDAQLEFMMPDQAYEKIKNDFLIMGIPIGNIYKYKALDLKTMETQSLLMPEEYDKNNNIKGRKFTQDDECYVFYLISTIDNIPITARTIEGTEMQTPIYGQNCSVFYSKEGIEYLEISNMLSLQSIQSTKTILDLDQATQALSDIMDTVIDPPHTTIKTIQLEYFPTVENKEKILSPVWVFTGEQERFIDKAKTGGKEVSQKENVTYCIDAVTGKEVI